MRCVVQTVAPEAVTTSANHNPRLISRICEVVIIPGDVVHIQKDAYLAQ